MPQGTSQVDTNAMRGAGSGGELSSSAAAAVTRAAQALLASRDLIAARARAARAADAPPSARPSSKSSRSAACEVVAVRLYPHRSGAGEMTSRGCETEIDQPRLPGTAEIQVAAVAGDDQRNSRRHRLRRREIEPLPARRQYHRVRIAEQRQHRRLVDVFVDNLDWRQIRPGCPQCRKLLGDVVVRIGEALDHQPHRIAAPEHLAPRPRAAHRHLCAESRRRHAGR